MLFIIDMQNDFIDQDRGKMPVKGANKLIHGIKGKILEYENKNDLIIYTLNIHENMPDDNRTNEEKTWGEDIYTPLKDLLYNHIPIKKYYYAISPNSLKRILNQYDKKDDFIKTIELVGVETNICILSNIIILQNLYPDSKFILDRNLCTGNNKDLHRNTLKILKEMNVEVK